MRSLRIEIRKEDILDKTPDTFICETDPVCMALRRCGLRNVIVKGLAFSYKEKTGIVRLIALPEPLIKLCEAYDNDQEIVCGVYNIDLDKVL